MNRRAFISTILLLVILISNSGIAIQKHYCMGRLQSIAIASNQEYCCDGMDMKAMLAIGCCENYVEVLTSSEFNLKSSFHSFTPEFEDITLTRATILLLFKSGESSITYEECYEPPPLISRYIFILVQSFLL